MRANDPPTVQECEDAVRRAAASRAAQYRGDLSRSLTPAAIAERVSGIAGRPERAQDGWWRVGRVSDAIADHEFEVLYRPRGLALSELERPTVLAPPPRYSRYHNDGLHGWRDAETGEGVDLAEVRRVLGVQDP